MTTLKMYYEQDADLSHLAGKRVAVIGFGAQGHAHALNLRDSGIDVVVAVREGGAGETRARAAGMRIMPIHEAAAWANVIVMLVPDETMADIYQQHIAGHLVPGDALVFAHGLNIHFGKIVPPTHVHVFMVAPKGPGRSLRAAYLKGSGLACLFAVHQAQGASTTDLALSYAKAIGGTRVGVFESSFKEETECDLFGEQAVLVGGMGELIRAGYDTLVGAGFSPHMAYFECLHEVKLIVDLLVEGGFTHMVNSISNTAEYGGYLTGTRIIDEDVRERMKHVLADIQSGRFAHALVDEFRAGGNRFKSYRDELCRHPIEDAGRAVRAIINQTGVSEREG